MSISSWLPPRRPTGYRGVVHLPMLLVVWPVAIGLCATLVTGPLRASLFVHVVTGLLMSASSVALNHTEATWEPGVTRLRKLDHTMIVVFVAGTFTPIATALDRPSAWAVLVVMCLLARLRMFVAWVGQEPRWLTSAISAASGTLPLLVVFSLPTHLWVAFVLGQVVYLLGAGVYLWHWPNPKPQWCGYHGFFHILTNVGSLLHLYVTFSLALAAAPLV